MTRIWLVSLFSCLVSGVSSAVCPESMPEMWPTSVDIPVEVDQDRARAAGDLGVHERQVDAVAERGVGRARRRPAWGPGRSRRSARTRRSRASPPRIMRPSAGTRSPASTMTMSPGTMSSMSTTRISPPRRTLALTTIIFWSAATLASALPSWLRPRNALKHRQQDQHDAGHELAGQEQADDAGAQQHDLHRVAVLAQEGSPAWLLRRLGELVRRRTWRVASRPRRRSARRPDRRAAPRGRPRCSSRASRAWPRAVARCRFAMSRPPRCCPPLIVIDLLPLVELRRVSMGRRPLMP